MKLAAFLLVLAVLVVGCYTSPSTTELADLRIGMSKDEVVRVLGKPDEVTCMVRPDGHNVELWIYDMRTPGHDFMTNWPRRDEPVFFFEGHVFAWGRHAGLPETPPDTTIEIRVR